MAQGNFQDALEWAQTNNFNGFEVFTGSDKQGALLFKSNKDLSFDSNISALKGVMARTNGAYFTFVGWLTAEKNKGQFKYEFENLIANKPSINVATVGSSNTGIPEDLVQMKIDAAVGNVKYEFAQRDLERREKELSAQQQEFRQQKESTLGIVVTQLGKILPTLFPVLQVAGTNDAPIPAIPARPSQDPSELFPDVDATQADNNQVEDLMNRWYAADPDCIALLEKIVALAESKDAKYTMAKQML